MDRGIQELMVFWSSDPESTNGAYAAYEGTQRRLWAKQLGIEFVHIDPHPYDPLRRVARICARRDGRRAEDAGVAGE